VSPARPRPAIALAAVLCASAVIGFAACGGDGENKAGPQPAKTKAPTSTESTSSESSTSATASTTTTEDNGGVQPDDDNGQGSGGSNGGSGPEDTPSHDITPPADTPQGKFEQYCNQNPGACG
jgi:hypothetical protein